MTAEEAADLWLAAVQDLLRLPSLKALSGEDWDQLVVVPRALASGEHGDLDVVRSLAVGVTCAQLAELADEHGSISARIGFGRAAVRVAPETFRVSLCSWFARHPNKYLRARGMWGVGQLDSPGDQALELLRDGLADDEPFVRQEAAETLTLMKGLPAGWSRMELLRDLYVEHARYRRTDWDIYCEALFFLALVEEGQIADACEIADAFEASDLTNDTDREMIDLVADEMLSGPGQIAALVVLALKFGPSGREAPHWLEFIVEWAYPTYDVLRRLVDEDPGTAAYWDRMRTCMRDSEAAGLFGGGLLVANGAEPHMRATGADLLGLLAEYIDPNETLMELALKLLLHQASQHDQPVILRRSLTRALGRLLTVAAPGSELVAEGRVVLIDCLVDADPETRVEALNGLRAAVTRTDVPGYLSRTSAPPGSAPTVSGGTRGGRVASARSEPSGGALDAPTDHQPHVRAPIGSEVLERLELYPWQRRALESWCEAGRQGVVEAVTGAGKTRVAIAAIADVLRAGGDVVVLVPTLQLGDQWERELRSRLPGTVGRWIPIGRLGGGKHSTLASHRLLVATMASAARRDLEPDAEQTLLVADEVHRAGAETWSLALDPSFSQRLGLTATYERENDLGVECFLDPYFGGVRASVGYGEALADGVVCRFRVALVGVSFTAGERAEYDEAAGHAARLRARLINDWDCPPEPFGTFLTAVHRLSASGVAEGSRLAGFYLSAFTRRRAVLAEASGKLSRLADLAPAVAAADKTILFAQSKQAAADAVGRLATEGVTGAVLHSGMDLDARAKVFGGFEDGTHELIAAPRLLDEGIDVPSADLALVLSSSRSRRQMIQRMGRVLRPKSDGRSARLAIFYVEGTSEDPAEAAHEGFLELILPHADELRTFSAWETTSLSSYLTP